MEFNPAFKPHTIKEGRHVKGEAREQKVNLVGGKSRTYKEKVTSHIDERISEAIETHKEWIEHKIPLLEGEDSIPTDLIDTFRSTLGKRIKQYARLNKIDPENLISDETFEPIFHQAVFDFIQSLKASKQRGDTPKQSIQLAGLSHWLDPRTIDQLTKKYADRVDQSVVSRAALSYPKDPDAFIEGYITTINRLMEKYADRVDEGVIKYSALYNPKDPDAYIDWFISSENHLLSIPGLTRGQVQDILLSNAFKKPEELEQLL